MKAPSLQVLQQRVKEHVTDQQVADFQRDGAVCIRQLLNADEIALLRDGIEANLAAPSARAKVASRPDDPGRFFEDFCNWQTIPQLGHFIQDTPRARAAPRRRAMVASRPDDPGRFFEDFCNWQTIPQLGHFIQDTPLALAAQRLMASSTVRLYHDHVLVKEPGTRQRTPWHQDQPYYNIEGQQNVSMWIPVDPVSRSATLEFIAGSHKGPWLMPRTFMDNQAKWFPEGSLADLPDVEAARDQFPILGWDIEPGDFVCFHMLTLHAAGGVEGSNRRRVFSVRFLGDDIRHAPRRWATSPDFAGLEAELPAGAPMEHPLFPLMAT